MKVKNRIKQLNIEEIDKKIKTLSPIELRYFRVMKAQSGVLFITAKPGIGKSAIARSIADKMGMRYMDIRLSMVDETDVGLFPNVGEVELGNGQKLKVLEHIVPKWAQEANDQPTLIHFEELNRAPHSVRNAALQLLLERTIGTQFKFNTNVFMMASGNLGEEDGTDVDEFDAALNNRLIHIKHDLLPQEWIQWFAKDNVHPDIVAYIANAGHKMYVPPNENSTAYASPRSWTFLSDYIINNFGEIKNEGTDDEYMDWGKAQDYIGDIERVGMSYVGNEILGFSQFIQNRIQISIDDIINSWKTVEGDVKEWRENNQRDRYSQMLRDLKEKKVTEFDKKQVHNCIQFLKECAQEERAAYLLDMVDDPDVDLDNNSVEKMLLEFREELVEIRKMNQSEKTK
ncbi:MAG: ATPase [uncultured marine phage]|uniref:ATPase n=1 Tax=uncultured marine phage TaxID=707152 RepID=A0A8D9FRH1_9VIRU|nr:MAG: ATPase [uncultured marine phage]